MKNKFTPGVLSMLFTLLLVPVLSYSQLSISTFPTNVSCNGNGDGSAVVMASGGTAPYTYSWSPAGGSSCIATGLDVGTYTITVTDNASLTASASFVINQPSLLGISIASVTNATHNGGTGSITAAASGGTSLSVINSIAGNRTLGDDGNGGPATAAQLFFPTGIAFDRSNNLYITDGYGLVKEVNSATGIINTIAGNIHNGGTYTGDGGPATGAGLSTPTGIAIDTSGNIFIAELYNNVIREVNKSTGIITTVAGNNSLGLGYSGDGGSATAAELHNPYGVAVDNSGNIFISDGGNNVIREVNASNGNISTIAGNDSLGVGFSGDGGPATAAQLNAPEGIALDASGHHLYIAEFYNDIIREVDITTGTISTAAGNYSLGRGYTGDGVPATATTLYSPYDVKVDASGNLFIADYGSNIIREVNHVTGYIHIIAGIPSYSPSYSGDGGPAIFAQFAGPIGVAVNSLDSVFIADDNNQVVREVSPATGTTYYSYHWTPGGETNYTGTDTDLDAGTYTVTATDGNFCTAMTTATITQPPAVSINAIATANISCNGENNGTALVSVISGVSPFTYSWSPISDNDSVATGLSPGTYTVTVTDINTSSASASVTITQPMVLGITIETVINAPFGGTGSAAVSGSGGTIPYTYSWSNDGGVDSTASGLSAGTYTVTITDANSCTTITPVIINQLLALNASANILTNISCNGENNGSASVIVSGSITPYTYSWSPSGGNSSVATGLSVGTYTITVTDMYGSTSSSSVTVTQPALLGVTVDTVINAPSFHLPGSITVSASGGTTPYTYSWNPSEGSDSTASGITAGTYTVTVTDANSCIATISATITQPPGVYVTASVIFNPACNGENNGIVAATAIGGILPYTYSWSPITNNDSIVSGLGIGTYTVTVKDNVGSTSSASITLTQPTVLGVSIDTVIDPAFHGGTGSITVSASRGTPLPIISTIGGNGIQGYSGDGSLATTAELNAPGGIAVDGSGNIFIADEFNDAVREINYSTGDISTIAGTGGPGHGGDGGPATAAQLCYPSGVAIDDSDNVFIADKFNSLIREVNHATGIISTVAGTFGYFSYSGDGGPATAAELAGPVGIAVDASDNIFIADYDNSVIREVNRATGIISTVAGNHTLGAGYSGDGGLATAAELNNPDAIAIDYSGNIFIAEYTNDVIREVNHTTGIISTIAGMGGSFGNSGDGGPATAAKLGAPGGIAVDGSDNVFIADSYNQVIREVNYSTGNITAVAGILSTFGYSGDGGAAIAAEMDSPTGVALDGSGNIFIADYNNNAIREASSAGSSYYSYQWSPGGGTNASDSGLSIGTYTVTVTDAHFCTASVSATITQPIIPLSVNAMVASIIDCNGENNGSAAAIVNGGIPPYTYSWSPITDNDSVATGLGAASYTVTVTDSAGNIASAFVTITQPSLLGATVTSVTNAVSYGGTGSAIVSASGGTPLPIMSTIAGNGGGGYNGDGSPATAAQLHFPNDVAVDNSGNIFIADSYNNVIREVNSSTGDINTVAGTGSIGSGGDGGLATAAQLYNPLGIAIDNSGNILIADNNNDVVREVNSTTGIISTVAGNRDNGYSGDGGPATAAEFKGARGVAIDYLGNIFIADNGNNVIREVNHATGIISTVAGNNSLGAGYSGDGGSATAAELNNPYSVAVDYSGNLFIAEYTNDVIRKVNHATGIISTLAGTAGYNNYSGNGGPATAAELSGPFGVSVDRSGNVFIADSYNNVIREVNSSTGIINTVAGDYFLGGGNSGDGGPATAAQLDTPTGIAIDGSGNIFIANEEGNVIREASSTGSTYYSYQWSPGVGTNAADTGLSAGTYTVTVTDAHSCTTSVSVTVTQPSGLTVTAIVTGNISCNGGGNDGGAIALGFLGTPPYTYSWTPAGGNDSIASGLSAGTYTVVLTDNASNTTSASVVITQPAALGITINSVTNATFNGGTGAIAASVSGGTPLPIMITAAGNGGSGYSGDGGAATAAQLTPVSVAADDSGNYFIVDNGNRVIRKVNHATGIISTVAGDGLGGSTANGVPATTAYLSSPNGVYVDYSDNIFIADASNGVIREVNSSTGDINTVAGTYYTYGYSGDGGPATAAECNQINGVAVDLSDNIYIIDGGNNVIREVNHATGIINTVAGNYSLGSGYSGDGGFATAAQLNSPKGIAVDYSGNLYIADTYNHVIREVNHATGIISTVAGTGGSSGYSGNGGPATAAELYYPNGVALDYSGNLFISDEDNDVVREVNHATGIISTVAGTARSFGYSGDGGPATAAKISILAGIAVDGSDDIFIADENNNVIREATSSGSTYYAYKWLPAGGDTSTASNLLAGTYTLSVTDANSCTASISATITQPLGTLSGNVIASNVSCNGNNDGSILAVVNGGATPYTYSWSPAVGSDSVATGLSPGTYSVTVTDNIDSTFSGTATITQPSALSIAIDSIDNGNGSITVSASGGTPLPIITTVAGNYSLGAGYGGEGGPATAAQLSNPIGVALDDSGNIYIPDTYNEVVEEVNNATGIITTVAGNYASGGGYSGDGSSATAAQLNNPVSVAIDHSGNIFIADEYNYVVREVNHATGNISTVAGMPYNYGYSGDGGPATAAKLSYPVSVALDGSGNLFIADANNEVIREVNHATGNISTVAGDNSLGYGYSGDGGPATTAQLNSPTGLATDLSGNLFIADQYNGAIREVNHATGDITTVAGTGSPGYNGNEGSATSTQLSNPNGVAIDASGNLFISDGGGYIIWEVNHATGNMSIVAGKFQYYSYNGDGNAAIATEFSGVSGVAVNNSGNIFIADVGNNLIRETTSVGSTYYSYSWSPGGETGAAVSYLSPGAYTVTATDANSCTASISATIVSPLYISTSATNVSCNGENNGSASAIPSGGLSPYTYAWVPIGGSDSTATGLSPGTYTVTVTDNAGTTILDSSIITQPTILGVSLSSVGTSACSGATGSIAAAVSGGSPFQPVINTIAGNYSLGGSYSGDGSPATAAALTYPSGIAIDGSGNIFIADYNNNAVREVNHSTGDISTVAGNGYGAGTYSGGYSGDGGPATAAELSGPNGVAIDNSGNIFIADYTNQVIREVNHSTGNISTVAGNGYGAGTYNGGYSGDGGLATAAEINGPAYVAIDGSGNLFIADGNNQVIREVNNSTGIINTIAGNDSLGGGYSGDGSAATAAQLDYPEGIAIDGSDNLFIADAGNNVIREVNSSGIISTVVGNNVTNEDYGYSGDGGLATGAELSGPTGVAVDGSGNIFIADSYNEVIREVNHATDDISTVAGNYSLGYGYSGDGGPAIAARLNSPNDVVPDASGDIFIADTYNSVVREVASRNGLPNYSYQWSPSGGTDSAASGLSAGTYTVTITDANSCTVSASTTISQHNSLTTTATVINEAHCNVNSGSAYATPSGGIKPYTYSWTDSSSALVSTSDTASQILAVGSYTVAVSDSNGCTVSASITITQAIFKVFPAITEVTCNGPGNDGTINVSNVSGGTAPYTYSWSPGGSTTTNDTITGLGAGTYTVTVNDANGCSASRAATILQIAVLPTAFVSANVSCNGGSNGQAKVSVTAGATPYTYSWTNGNSTYIANGLSAGSYTVTVTDKNGCYATSGVTITQPAPIKDSVAGITYFSCAGGTGAASIGVEGGSTPYTYTWSPNVSATSSATGLTVRSYAVQVKDNNGCYNNVNFTLSQPPVLRDSIVSASKVNASCLSLGSAMVGVKYGITPYTYSWSSGGGTSATANGLLGGTYTITVTDAGSCNVTASVTITQPSSGLSSTAFVGTNASCNGDSNGQAKVSVNGGKAPYTYSWSPVNSSTYIANGLSAGIYTVTVTDNNGCSATSAVAITQPTSLRDSVATISYPTCSVSVTSATVGVKGGVSPYRYTWSPNVSTTNSATGLLVRSYVVQVKDNNSCWNDLNFSISQPPPLLKDSIIKGSVVNATCSSNGSATVGVKYGVTPYTYSWSPGSGTGSTANGLSAGTYTITVNDAGSCTTTTSVSVIQVIALPLSATAFTGASVSCNGGSNGQAKASVNGGVPPFAYSWSPANNSTYINDGLSIGTYTVTVTDNCGTSVTSATTITQPAVLKDSVASINYPPCTGGTGNVTIGVMGGTSPYRYTWSPNVSSTDSASGLIARGYAVQVKDNNNCLNYVTVNVTCSNPPTATYKGTNASCCLTPDNINLYPNPNTGQFTLSGLQKGMILEIYDYTGKKISTSTVTNQVMQLNISQADGVYLVRILDKDGNLVSEKKVMKIQ